MREHSKFIDWQKVKVQEISDEVSILSDDLHQEQSAVSLLLVSCIWHGRAQKQTLVLLQQVLVLLFGRSIPYLCY